MAGWDKSTEAGISHFNTTMSMANQTINYLVSEAERYQHSWAGVMDQTVADYRHAGRAAADKPGDIAGEQQAMFGPRLPKWIRPASGR